MIFRLSYLFAPMLDLYLAGSKALERRNCRAEEGNGHVLLTSDSLKSYLYAPSPTLINVFQEASQQQYAKLRFDCISDMIFILGNKFFSLHADSPTSATISTKGQQTVKCET